MQRSTLPEILVLTSLVVHSLAIIPIDQKYNLNSSQGYHFISPFTSFVRLSQAFILGWPKMFVWVLMFQIPLSLFSFKRQENVCS